MDYAYIIIIKRGKTMDCEAEEKPDYLTRLKKETESKHKRITKYLQKKFQDCTVKYNGVEGIDLYIEYKDKKTWIEIKTCDKIICNGLDHQKMNESHRPEVFNIHRNGRFKFDRRYKMYPYNISQHDDLVELDGWYLFFAGRNMHKNMILFGIKAKDVELTDKNGLKQREWGQLCMQSHPDWLERLKDEVYGKHSPNYSKYVEGN